jgi:hypothetical protein
MAMNPIDVYLHEHLAPQLAAYSLTEEQISILLEDVRSRLASVVCRRHDVDFRRTILHIGMEEGYFYDPRSVSLSVRALVVIGIRDSLVGDLNAEKPVSGYGNRLPDTDVPRITSEAVRFFSETDLGAITCQRPRHDVFGMLPKRYPVAWTAFSHLARTNGGETTHYPRVNARVPRLPAPVPAEEIKPGVVVLSGMASEFDFVLVEELKWAARRKEAFFIDSWKFLTRNPHKLFLGLEYVLAGGGKIVTHNAYLENGTVSCRRGFLRPAHMSGPGQVLPARSGYNHGSSARAREDRG